MYSKLNETEIINMLSALKHRVFPRPFERLGVKGNNLVGVEIGVYKGEHAKSLLDNLSISQLFLIDPYTLYKEYEEGKKHYGIDQDPLDVAEKEAQALLAQYPNIVWVRQKSADALKVIPDKLDFVYIDGNHKYENVREDIANYYGKLNSQGVFGGHDMYNGYQHEHDGVVQAVTEFSVNNGLQLYLELPDWWVTKRNPKPL